MRLFFCETKFTLVITTNHIQEKKINFKYCGMPGYKTNVCIEKRVHLIFSNLLVAFSGAEKSVFFTADIFLAKADGLD